MADSGDAASDIIDIDEMEDEFEDGDEYEDEEEEFGSAEDAEEETAETEGGDADIEIDAKNPKGGRGNPLGFIGKLRPSEIVKLCQRQTKHIQHLIWHLEDASVFTAKFAVKAAVKAARPLLVWFIISRASRTVQWGRDPAIRMLRLPPEEQMDYYYSQLLGADWEKKMEQDMLDSLQEVADGYITDDMVEEKRKLAAVMLRRMEVEEWDKQRMKHFYYGLYGLGPWYWDMEERLHNPFFVGARGWNGPPESWVNENQTFSEDIPAEEVDARQAALAAIEGAKGRRLRPEARRLLLEGEQLSPLDLALAGPAFKGVVDPLKVREQLQEREAQGT